MTGVNSIPYRNVNEYGIPLLRVYFMSPKKFIISNFLIVAPYAGNVNLIGFYLFRQKNQIGDTNLISISDYVL